MIVDSPQNFEFRKWFWFLESPLGFKNHNREIGLKIDSFTHILKKKVLPARRYHNFSGSGARLREEKVFKAPLSPGTMSGLY